MLEDKRPGKGHKKERQERKMTKEERQRKYQKEGVQYM
jgi:hypothetical protein